MGMQVSVALRVILITSNKKAVTIICMISYRVTRNKCNGVQISGQQHASKNKWHHKK